MPVQLIVVHMDDTRSYHPVSLRRGWKICPTRREIIVGGGLPRTHIPLDNVKYYNIEEY